MKLPDFSQSVQFNALREEMGIDQPPVHQENIARYCYDCQQWLTNATELPAHPGHSIH